jgi:hypothetical protein
MVRETGMYCLYNLVSTICEHETQETRDLLLTPEIVEEIIGNLLQQLTEKIDKMRLVAGSILQRIFDHCYTK